MKRWSILGAVALVVMFNLFAWASDTKKEDDEDEKGEVEWTFEDTKVGAIPKGWVIAETAGEGHLATWKVMQVDGAPSGKHVLALTKTKNSGHTFNLAIVKEQKFKDLEIELKVKAMTGEEDQGGGPIWRVKDANNYYICRWNPLENNFRVYYVKNGRRKQLASANVKTDSSKWHEIKIEMEGDEIEAYFDDKKLIETEDSTFTEEGYVGIWTKADAASQFDDLEVEVEEDEG